MIRIISLASNLSQGRRKPATYLVIVDFIKEILLQKDYTQSNFLGIHIPSLNQKRIMLALSSEDLTP